MELKFRKLFTCWYAVAAVAGMICLTGNAAAQETSAPVDNTQPAVVHQIGIIRGGQKVTSDNLLSLPGFVHRSTNYPTTGGVWLDFSALYVIPPQMTTEPVTLQVRQSASGGGFVSAWYPYAEGPPDGNKRE